MTTDCSGDHSAKSSLVVMHKHPFIEIFRYVKRLEIDLDRASLTIAALNMAIFADTDVVSELKSSDKEDFAIDFYEMPEPVREDETPYAVMMREISDPFRPVDVIREMVEPRTSAVEDPVLKRTREDFEARVNWHFLRNESKSLCEDSVFQGVEDSHNLLVVICPLPTSKCMERGNIWARVNAHREAIATAAQKRTHPSLEARNDRLYVAQRPSRLDGIYNGRGKSMFPPSHFHPAWSVLQPERIDVDRPLQSEFSSEEISAACSFMAKCRRRSVNQKGDLIAAMEGLADAVHRDLFTPRTLNSPGGQFAPDGVVYGGLPTVDGRRPIMCITEVLVESHGAEEKAQQAYLAYYCSKEAAIFRQVSSCPCLLLCVMGDHVVVHGAMFSDRILSHILDHFSLHLNLSRIRKDDCSPERIATFFRAFRAALQELDAYYTRIADAYQAKALAEHPTHLSTPASAAPTTLPNLSCEGYVGPHFRTFEMDGRQVNLTYTGRTREDPIVAAYHAYATFADDVGSLAEPHEVSVLFFARPAASVHQLLANSAVRPGAARLWLFEWVESAGSFVVVVDRFDREGPRSGDCSTVLQDFVALEKKARSQDLEEADICFRMGRDSYIQVKDKMLLIDFDTSEEARAMW
ncbi:hypothetical protein FKP32DRAFT_1594890 [Trametes sanguinea]|nr:hypothetical protein FKP32DRAFT_1594890 [Trametes sanguinea]